MENLKNKFANIYPFLDLHGEEPALIFVLIDNFIKDNYKLGNTILVVIHGKGTYAVQKETHYILSNHKLVKQFILDPDNLGQTIIEIEKRNIND